MTTEPIVFSKPYQTEHELANVQKALDSGHVHGDGRFTRAATEKLKAITGAAEVLLMTSCTHALEEAGMLLDFDAGDEVILPSFNFPSAADAVALRGARCVFVDIDPQTG